MERSHWFIRCGDGKNFVNSKYPFWGMKRGHHNTIKSFVKRIQKGDILWFITNKAFGGKIIGMAEYVNFYDRQDEPLVDIHTISSQEQGWDGEDYDIQLNYCKLYRTEQQELKVSIQCASIIIHYDVYRKLCKTDVIDLEYHYRNYIFYAEEVVK
jgi:hypothetical protein